MTGFENPDNVGNTTRIHYSTASSVTSGSGGTGNTGSGGTGQTGSASIVTPHIQLRICQKS
jgi:hypothetical protein